ncbi:MAG: hypothetical protein ABI697_10260, partial [Devosia sp.]
MNKTLFSLAFLAASGGYVVYANHGLDGALPASMKPEETAAVVPVAPEQSTAKPAALKPAAATPATTAPPVVVPSVAPAAAPAPVFVAEAVPAPAATTPVVMPAMPPLPRPRPADAPTIQTAQATSAQTGGGQYRDGTYTGTDEN